MLVDLPYRYRGHNSSLAIDCVPTCLLIGQSPNNQLKNQYPKRQFWGGKTLVPLNKTGLWVKPWAQMAVPGHTAHTGGMGWGWGCLGQEPGG